MAGGDIVLKWDQVLVDLLVLEDALEAQEGRLDVHDPFAGIIQKSSSYGIISERQRGNTILTPMSMIRDQWVGRQKLTIEHPFMHQE
jgi:hypothetical protein